MEKSLLQSHLNFRTYDIIKTAEYYESVNNQLLN